MFFVSFSLLQIVLIYEYQFGFMLNENGLTLFFHIFELISIFQSNFQLNGSEFSSIIQQYKQINTQYILHFEMKIYVETMNCCCCCYFCSKRFFFHRNSKFFPFTWNQFYVTITVSINICKCQLFRWFEFFSHISLLSRESFE